MNYCNPEGYRKEIRSLLENGDIDAFYNWFDGGETKEGAFKKGYDVFNRVIFPYVQEHLGSRMKNKKFTALDLGYGAATKIQAALEFFPIVYGVDVHDQFDFVFESLEVPEDKEVRLLVGDGNSLPMGASQVDFVYSWTTLCHVGTIENIENYLKEIKRVLKSGGVAALFFTRLIRSSKEQTWDEVLKDMEKEKQHSLGYREGGPESKVRTINFVLSMWKMEELVKNAGFVVLDKTASWDDSPEGKIYHGQYGIIFGNPAPGKKTNQLKRKKK